MARLFKYIMEFLLSLRTAIWSLSFLIAALFAGAFIMPAKQEFQSIHSLPLFIWLNEQPASATWWLWLSIGILALLTINTIFCSIESIIKKRKVTQWLLLISPQIIHIGFLFILLAHLFSAFGSSQGMAVAREGSFFNMPGGYAVLHVKKINLQISPYGYVTGWGVEVEYLREGMTLKDTIEPNSPFLKSGLNINVKDLQAFPEKAVLLQISREPGAVWALIGGALFMIGIITLAALKIKTERI